MQTVYRWVVINKGFGRADKRAAAAYARHTFPKRTVKRWYHHSHTKNTPVL